MRISFLPDVEWGMGHLLGVGAWGIYLSVVLPSSEAQGQRNMDREAQLGQVRASSIRIPKSF